MNDNLPPNNLPWALSRWRAISTGTSPLRVNGVLFQDIFTILKNMLEIPSVRMWTESVSKMYDHLSTSGMAHNVTPEQFETGVIEYVYSIYRQHGYTNDYDFFLLMLFTYLEIVQFEDLLKDEVIILTDRTITVKALNEYINKHNELIEEVHDNLLERIMPGDSIPYYPSLAYSKYHFNTDFVGILRKDPSKLLMFGNTDYLPQIFTVCIGSVFYNVNQTVARLYSETTLEGYKINYSWDNKNVNIVHTDELGMDHTVFDIDVSDYVTAETASSSRIGCILIFNRLTVTLVMRLYTSDYTRDYYQEVITSTATGSPVLEIVPDTARNANYACLDVNTITMDPWTEGNIVEYVIIYTNALTLEQAKAVLVNLEHPSGLRPSYTRSYSIVFNGDWTPTDKFNEIFELVNVDGTVANVATASTSRYRFKEYKDNYADVVDVNYLFEGCSTLESIILPDDWNEVVSTKGMFKDCTSLINVKLPSDWGNVKDTSEMFMGCIVLEDVDLLYTWGEITTLESMFNGCTLLNNIYIPSQWGTVVNTERMFNECSSLSSIVLPSDWANMNNVIHMFRNCISLNSLILPSDWNTVNNYDNIFYGCTSFVARIGGLKLADEYYKSLNDELFPDEAWISGIGLDFLSVIPTNPLYEIKVNGSWRPTAKFTNSFELVNNDGIIVTVATSDVTKYRFRLGKENYNDVTDTIGMFMNAITLEYIELPPTWGNVTDVSGMFQNCVALERIILPDDWGMVTNTSSMFDDCFFLNNITIPVIPDTIDTGSEHEFMFNRCAFTVHSSGIIISENYYQSPMNGVFPTEVWKLGIGLDDLPAKRPIYNITFNGDWTPTDKFNEVFELIDVDENILTEASVVSVGYRFKEGQENYNYCTSTDGMFKNCHTLQSIELPLNWGYVTSAKGMFYNCSTLSSITIPYTWNEMTDIGFMFSGCKALLQINIPSSWANVEIISAMFSGCSSLLAVKVPTSWERVVNAHALFSSCSSLTSIVLPNHWGRITDTSWLFQDCRSLINVTIPNDWNKITDISWMFTNTNITNIIIPNSWGEIVEVSGAFDGCYYLKNITLPVDWRYVQNTARMFASCYNLVAIDLPATWGRITDVNNMFINCTSLTNVTLPVSWSNIVDLSWMFANSGLTNIVLPPTWGEVEEVKFMFSGCEAMVNITMPSDWGMISNAKSMFCSYPSFIAKTPGILVSENYYSSSETGMFPEECYRFDLGMYL